MERKMTCPLKHAFLKWIVLSVFVLAVSLPLGSRTCLADSTDTYRVSVPEGYLALRTAKAYDRSNEIGKLYTGDYVEALDTSGSTYWYVYASSLGMYGYVNKNYLIAEASNVSDIIDSDGWTVKVDSGYLALRNAKAYDSKNEIGKLYTGDVVEVQDTSDSTYWYVYSPKLGKSGYVNRNYLIAPSDGWTVKVDSGYLALRTAKAYDSSNEIGKLYTGDVVEVQDTSDSTYWYVYSSKLGKFGYVNRNYLIAPTTSAPVSGETWTVKVDSGYLALRTAKAFDRSNEIGELYTGDTVQVQDTSDSTYWYVYSPKLGRYGYVNRNYLFASSASAPVSGETWTVRVDSGYLALRTAKAFDRSNEIGELYTGDTVKVQDTSDSTYWYVYSPKLGRYGYVNSDYLY